MACLIDVGEGVMYCKDALLPTSFPDGISQVIVVLSTLLCNMTNIRMIPASVQWISIQSCCTNGDETSCVVVDRRECPTQQCATINTAETYRVDEAEHVDSAEYGGGWWLVVWLLLSVMLLVVLCVVRACLTGRCCRSLTPRCLTDRCRRNSIRNERCRPITIRYDRRNQRVVGLSTALRDASTLASFEHDALSLNNTAPTHATVLDQSSIVSHLHMMAGQPASCADPGYVSFLSSLIEDANRTEEPEKLKEIIAKAVIAYPRCSSPVI
uniref:Uncharacterized protein n=1 Tax=Plectus sambesii TaxID=2011161 RepID=A0A914XSK5_9BILA